LLAVSDKLIVLVVARHAVSSRISIADADPAGKELPRHRRSTVSSETGTVSFTPDDIRPRKKRTEPSKDEL
jgi:hypothetical protein